MGLVVSSSDLEQYGYSLQHGHMRVVDIEVMTSSTGERIHQTLLDLSDRVGPFLQIICDHGSDLQKGIRLYKEAYPNVISTYDITHKTGCILKKYFEKDSSWISFSKDSSQTIPKVQQTELKFLASPKQKQKARYLNIHEQVEWGMNLLDYEEREDFSEISEPFRLVKEEWDPELRIQLSKEEDSIVSSFPSKEYPNQNLFEQDLKKHVGETIFKKGAVQ